MPQTFLVVAAIDFGTAYSGYAFSFIDDFKRDPLTIHVPQAWTAGSRRLVSSKTPTCLLLNKKREFVAFGYEAEDKYAQLVANGQHGEYFFFETFKMSLHNNPNVSRDMQLEDINKKKLPALDVFSHSIKYLTGHFIKALDDTGAIIRPNEIRWVLTVPAIWTDRAKEFMTESAKMAGIPPNQLLIALEPEAASIYYQYKTSTRCTDQDIEKGDVAGKYMIVDLGGGTADITAHERCSDGTLKEIARANGANCGGFTVNKAFMKMLDDILDLRRDVEENLKDEMVSQDVGDKHTEEGDFEDGRKQDKHIRDFENELKAEDLEDYIDLVRDFEFVKRRFKPNTDLSNPNTDLTNIAFPSISVNNLCERIKNMCVQEILESSSFSNSIYLKRNKLCCSRRVMSDLFTEATQNITKLVEETLGRINQEILHIILVGGFAECCVLQDAIKQKLPEKKIIKPLDCGLSVLQGAVLFGHKPEIIGHRVMKFTYGISTHETFDPNKHDNDHFIIKDGKPKCKNAFDILINIDAQAKFGETVDKEYYSFLFQEEVSFQMFATVNPNPIYTDTDDCSLVGKLIVKIPKPHDVQHTFKTKVFFGETVIRIEVEECQTGERYDATFDRFTF